MCSVHFRLKGVTELRINSDMIGYNRYIDKTLIRMNQSSSMLENTYKVCIRNQDACSFVFIYLVCRATGFIHSSETDLLINCRLKLYCKIFGAQISFIFWLIVSVSVLQICRRTNQYIYIFQNPNRSVERPLNTADS